MQNTVTVGMWSPLAPPQASTKTNLHTLPFCLAMHCFLFWHECCNMKILRDIFLPASCSNVNTYTHVYRVCLTVTIRPLSWKYLTRGMVFCLKLVRRRSMALGLSSGRPCCSARFCSLSFKWWLVQARNTTRSGVQIYQEREKLLEIQQPMPHHPVKLSIMFWPWGNWGTTETVSFLKSMESGQSCNSHKNSLLVRSEGIRFFYSTVCHLDSTGLSQCHDDLRS